MLNPVSLHRWTLACLAFLVGCHGEASGISVDASTGDASSDVGAVDGYLGGPCSKSTDCPSGYMCGFRSCGGCGGGECMSGCTEVADAGGFPTEACDFDGGTLHLLECDGFGLGYGRPVKWVGACDIDGTICGIGVGCCGTAWMCTPGQTCDGNGCSWRDAGGDAACGLIQCPAVDPCGCYTKGTPVCDCTVP